MHDLPFLCLFKRNFTRHTVSQISTRSPQKLFESVTKKKKRNKRRSSFSHFAPTSKDCFSTSNKISFSFSVCLFTARIQRKNEKMTDLRSQRPSSPCVLHRCTCSISIVTVILSAREIPRFLETRRGYIVALKAGHASTVRRVDN